MKKILSILITISLITFLYSASCAEHLTVHFDCDVQPALSSTWQFWNNGNTIQMTDSIHQDYVVERNIPDTRLYNAYESIRLMTIKNSLFNEILTLIDEIAESGADSEHGVFTGDCFDIAISKKEIILKSDDFDKLIQKQSEKKEEKTSITVYHDDGIIIQWLQFIKEFLDQNILTLRTQIFDNGNYYCFQAERDNAVIYSFSVNRSDISNIHGVFSFSEEARIYDIGFQSMADGDHLNLSISVCSDPDKAGYRISSGKYSIIHMECHFYTEKEEKPINYECVLSSADQTTAIQFTGYIQPFTEEEILTLNIQYIQDKKDWGKIRILHDHAEYHQDNQTVISGDQENNGDFLLLKTSYEQYFMILLNRLVNPSFSY